VTVHAFGTQASTLIHTLSTQFGQAGLTVTYARVLAQALVLSMSTTKSNIAYFFIVHLRANDIFHLNRPFPDRPYPPEIA
jgi:hypothetical protein